MSAEAELYEMFGNSGYIHLSGDEYVTGIDTRAILSKITAALSEAHAQGFENCRRGLSELDDDELAEYGLMHVPLDMNGEQVHLGDKVHDCEDGYDFTVDGFIIWGDSMRWWVYQDESVQYPLDRCTLIKQPSVKDLLYEMYDRLDEPSGDDQSKTAEEIIAEYIDRLQLKEE